jgi:RHS repeat-associated protein
MQSALKYAYEVDKDHLPVGGATTADAVIRYQLVDYDDYGNLTHSVSPLSRSMDWVERVFRYTEDPFKATATETELTRCVKREPGAGSNSPHLPDVDKPRCSFGLDVFPELVRNVGVTHYSHSRVDTHSGMVAEVTDINGNGLLYDFDRWSRLRFIARGWGNAPRENKTFAQELKRAVAKTDAEQNEGDRKPGTDGNPDSMLSAAEAMEDVTDWRILALADYSCMDSQAGKVTDNCRSTPSPDGVLRSNLRRFESADTYSGLLQSGNTTRESAVFADGYGRPIQTLNEADVCLTASNVLFDPDNAKNVATTATLAARCSRPSDDKASGVAGIVVRPSTAVDALGRDLMSFEPYAPTNEPAPRIDSKMRLDRLLAARVEPAPLTQSVFDGAGRPLTIASRLAGWGEGAVTGTTQFRYHIRMKAGQAARFETLTLSPRCSAAATWTDSRGLTSNVFEGQKQRYRIGNADADSGMLPHGEEKYDRRLMRTAEPCLPIANFAADWANSAVHTDYAYDSLQQLKRVDYPFEDADDKVAADTSITVTYDRLGRMVQMQERNSGCTRYAYDALNLLTSEAGYRFEPGTSPVCGNTFQAHNEKSYTYSGDRLKSIAYHSLDEQGGVPDVADTATFYYDRYPFASLSGTPIEAEKYVLNDLANQHLIDVTGRFCDNCVGQATLVSDRSGARTFSYNELGLVRRELRSIVGPLEHVVKSAGEAETSVPELAAYEIENSYTAFGDVALEEFSESAPANPAEACFENGVDTCLSRFSVGRHYSPDGALAEIRFNGKTIVSSAQDALGRPAVRWTANGSMTGYRYDPTDLRLNQMTTLTGADQRVQMLEYHYDGDGNILDYRNRAAAASDYDSAFAFVYDPANRLQLFNTAVSARLDGAVHQMSAGGEFGYDARHRFIRRSLNIKEAGQIFVRSWEYEYDAAKGPFHAPKSVTFSTGTYPVGSDPVLQSTNTEFSYDEIGRMIGAAAPGEPSGMNSAAVISNRTMSWDGQGRLIQVRGLEDKAANDNAKWVREHYAYDAGGNRVLKMHLPDVIEPTASAKQSAAENALPSSTSYKADGEAKPRKIEAATIYMTPYYARPYNARGTVQLSVGTLPAVSMAAPADESEDPVATYLYADLPVGSMNAAVTAYGEPNNAAATLIARREYDPYGLPLTSEALSKAARPDLPALNSFHGKELDRVTGLSSFGARYYSRDLGMWLSPDPMRSSNNLYSFSANRPSGATDLDGNESLVVQGAEGDLDHNLKTHFFENALARAKNMRSTDPNTTLIIRRGGDQSKQFNSAIKSWARKAELAGINSKIVEGDTEIASYINSKGGNRSKDLRTRLSYVGHGFAGQLGPGAYMLKDGSYRLGGTGLKASDLSSKAFAPDCVVDLQATCNAATTPDDGMSMVDQFAKILSPRGVVSGLKGKADFYTQGVDTDQQLRQNRYPKNSKDYLRRSEAELVKKSGVSE